MAETKMIKFSHREVLEALVKHCDIHAGRWTLLVDFQFAAANAVLAPDGEALPAAATLIQGITLRQIESDMEVPINLMVDATKVNPKSKAKTSARAVAKKKKAVLKKR